MVLVGLTQAGGSVQVWLVTFIAHAPPDRNHPLAFSVAVHPRRGQSLRFTVGHARSADRNQGRRLRPRGGRRVGRQVEAGGWALAVKDGHAHEGNAGAAVDHGQDKSKKRKDRERDTTVGGGGGVIKGHSSRTREDFTLCA